jgi:ferredoxin-NADP reductase
MLQLKVEAIKWETSDTATFFLNEINGAKIAYQAGQFITLIFSHHRDEIRRSYSLSSSPHEDFLSITVKRMENGEISRFLLTKIRVGDILTALAPAGKFIEANPDSTKDIFYFAAGSGITPVYAQIKYVLSRRGDSTITLIYSSHQAKSALFYNDLNQLADAFPERLKVIYLFSVSEDNSPRKRLNNELLTQLVNNNLKYTADKAEFFICGPFVYMRMVKLTLTFMGFEAAQIRRENFVLETVPVSTTVMNFSPRMVKLHFGAITYDLMVGENQSILQAALQNNIQIPYSCRAGICSSCTAICKRGKVEMVVNDVLTAEDLKHKWILTCTGHPVSDDVEIEF